MLRFLSGLGRSIVATLAVLALLTCGLAAGRADPIVLDFHDIPGMPPLVDGQPAPPIPPASQLSTQYLATDGVRFASTEPETISMVAVVDLGYGMNGIGGSDGNSTLSFDPRHQIIATFYDPTNPFYEAVTDFVSVQADIHGNGKSVTLDAFDSDGNMIASDTEVDVGGETLKVSAPGIHYVEFLGNQKGDGVALENFAFDPVTAIPRVVLNFDEMSGMSYFEGTAISGGAKLSTQYVSKFGVRFRSGSDYCAVVTYPTLAYTTSGLNGLGGSTPTGDLTYDSDYPTVATFVDPAAPSNPAVTDFVSLRGDTIGTKNTPVTLNAYDVSGQLIGSDTETDVGGELLKVSAPGIHSVQFLGNHGKNVGVGIDDFTFDKVQPVDPAAK